MICGTIHAATFAADAMATTDCMIRAQVEQGYAGLLAPGGSLSLALTLLLTIYVAAVGYRLVLGQSRLTLAEAVPHFVKLGIVLALVSSWPSYQATVVELLFRGPTELANLIVARAAGTSGAPGEVLTALQQVFDRLADAAVDAWAQSAPAAAKGATPSPAGLGAPQFASILLWASAAVMMAVSLGALLVARIVLALLLLLGPLFIAAALFSGTRGLCDGWLRVTVRFALVPLFVLPLTAAMLAVVAPFAARLGDAPVDSVRDGPTLAIGLIVLVFAAVLTQATKIAGTLAAGIRLPRGHASPAAAALSTRDIVPPLAAAPGRAASIVEAIVAGDNRTRLRIEARGVATDGRRSDPGRPDPVVPGPRLGQSYRRLVVTAPR